MANPLRIIISGITGRMGQRVLKAVRLHKNLHVVAGLTSPAHKHVGQPISILSKQTEDTALILSDISDVDADMVIDFSQPEAFNAVVDYCVMRETALVSGTTGLSQSQFDRISQAGHFIPVLWAANFSLNIQIIKNLLQIFKKINDRGDYSITETHHVFKKDAPSGTAIALAQGLTDSTQLTLVADHQFKLGEISIQSIREAEVPGSHRIQCHFPHETITIEHIANNADLFAEGAVAAALWLAQQDTGLYDLNAILLA